VAALMPPAEGKRFLDDILPALQQQRREHERRVSSSLRR
jgi:polyhydroxyalkanoate synthesis regulator phasin